MIHAKAGRARGRVFATVRESRACGRVLVIVRSRNCLNDVDDRTQDRTRCERNVRQPGTSGHDPHDFGFFGVAVTQADKRSRLQF